MNFTDINAENLLASPHPVIAEVLNPKLGELPWHLMQWEDFQKLCTRLIQRQHLEKNIQVFQFGKAGQAQDGIDIIWKNSEEKKFSTAEVKHWKKIKPSNITTWTNNFIKGGLGTKSCLWILCLSLNIKDRELVKAWLDACEKLAAHDIKALLWDSSAIEDLLRESPILVEQFFSTEIRDRFCHTLSMPNEEPDTFRKCFLHHSESLLEVENESVRMEVLLPNEKSPKTSAIISFARPNLAGVSLAIDGKDLVRWLQWAGHPHDPLKGPYTRPLIDSKRFLLTTNKFQLSLDSKEFENLDWCLHQVWTHYLATTQSLESKWQCLRFKRLGDTSQLTFALYSVSRPLWRLIMDYVREHDYDKGDSDEHIFEASNGVLKVFSPRATALLDEGFHLISYIYSEGGITSSHESNVIVGWSPYPLNSFSSNWSPREYWDAEFTHDWFHEKLLPNLVRWYHQKTQKQLSWLTHPIQKFTGNFSVFEPEEHSFSRRNFPVQQITESGTQEELARVLHSIQAHFISHYTVANLETELLIAVLECVKLLAHRLASHHHNYIRGNLQLDQKSLVEALEELISKTHDNPIHSIQLEMALRSLICCCENIDNINSDIKWIKQKLEPVWARMREDLLCEIFS
ncbi:hypothetical protein Q1J52_14135 [Pseudomonas lijiangensis]|uniref:hypothetical protein n=1 Tax=Pseudomonas syringae group TaxID=136849 RepID=UPI0019EAA639|nr:hypothetical protein [Pseudomonas cichorii]GFM66960.1 hypothetical protein PSCICJ_30780 [Pseudomonas cichorii]